MAFLVIAWGGGGEMERNDMSVGVDKKVMAFPGK